MVKRSDKAMNFRYRPFTPSHSLEELEIRPKYHVTVVESPKKMGYQKEFAPTKDSIIEAGDAIWVISAEKNIQRLSADQGWVIKPEHEVFAKKIIQMSQGLSKALSFPIPT